MVVSANASEEQATVAGADVFLAKPFSPARLLAVLTELVARPSLPPVSRPLRELRAERLLSIHDLAQVTGVASETVHEIETGELQPGRRMVRRISAALEVDPRDVTEFGPQPPASPGGVEPDKVIARLEAMRYPHALAQRVGHGRPPVPADG
jgi:transcriptional regulator with XRE-family HTH domain